MNILLVDNSFVTGHGLLHMMLNLTSGLTLVEYLKDFREAGRICRSREVDCLVFNISCLDGYGVPFLRRLPLQWPDLRAIAMLPVIDRVSVEYLRRHTKVSGAFSANTSLRDFHDLLRRPMRLGAINFTPEIEDIIYSPGPDMGENEKLAILDRLSGREYDVLMLAITGASNTQIADRLNISSKTVCTHRHHIRKKFGARNMTEVYQTVVDIRKNSAPALSHINGSGNRSEGSEGEIAQIHSTQMRMI